MQGERVPRTPVKRVKKTNSKQELLGKIMDASQIIKNKPDVIRKSTQSISLRAKLIENSGKHFEHSMTPSHN